jgi:ComF family protein
MMPPSIFVGLADLVFPPSCANCGAPLAEGQGTHFCSDCAEKIGYISSPLCTRCGTPFSGGAGDDHLCGDCIGREPPFSVARAVGRYEATLLEAIHQFKYRGRIALGEILADMMARYRYPAFSPAGFSLVVPVPLHTKRLRQRMFNQSVILARGVAKRHALPLDVTALRRSAFTEPQISLGRDERAANVRGAFTVDAPARIEGKRVVLIDDVYTTGSTVRECCRVLARAGAAEIAVLTLARAV